MNGIGCTCNSSGCYLCQINKLKQLKEKPKNLQTHCPVCKETAQLFLRDGGSMRCRNDHIWHCGNINCKLSPLECLRRR